MLPRSLVLVVLSALCVSLTARPEPARADGFSLDLDPAQSTVRFTLGALLHTVSGTFALRQGTIRFDLASGQSSDAKRDARMRGEVLEAQTYPEAVFTASRVQGQLPDGSPSELDVDGVLAIHGDRHAMTLHVILERKDGSMTAHTRFSVPYVQWRMKDPSTFLLRVSKTVDVDVTAVGQAHPSRGNI
jgi:polyisoprenoid-binding protein YceI